MREESSCLKATKSGASAIESQDFNPNVCESESELYAGDMSKLVTEYSFSEIVTKTWGSAWDQIHTILKTIRQFLFKVWKYKHYKLAMYNYFLTQVKHTKFHITQDSSV